MSWCCCSAPLLVGSVLFGGYPFFDLVRKLKGKNRILLFVVFLFVGVVVVLIIVFYFIYLFIYFFWGGAYPFETSP